MSSLFLKKWWLVVLTMLSFPAILFSQTYQAFVKAGDKAYLDQDFYQSAFYYKSALELDSTHLEIAFNYATACRMVNDYQEALHWYSYVNNNRRDTACSTAPFWLGLLKKTDGKYKEAGSLFQKYLKVHGREETYYTKKARQEIKACAQAEKLAKQKNDFKIENAGPTINTPGADFNGQHVNDTVLLFSSVRGNNTFSHIYTSRKEKDKWQPATSITFLPTDSSIHLANGCFTSDGKTFYCTGCRADGTQGCGIYRSILKGGRWDPLLRLNDTINAVGATTTQPASKTDHRGNTVLYFASDRAGGYGKMDLWYSLIQPDGRFGSPVNMGSDINTEEDDISPFPDPYSNNFYFSSEWHSGLGGFDIFKSQGSLSQWSVPENVGPPLNSGYNDLYFTILKDQGTLTSNRPGGAVDPGSTCCNDIYFFHKDKKINASSSEVKDSISISVMTRASETFHHLKKLMPVIVYFNNDFPEPKSHKITCPDSYEYYYKEYLAIEPLYINSFGKEAEIFFNERVKKGFKDLEDFTRSLHKALAAGLRMRIKIEGYCSPLTSSSYNHHLAQRRIASLINYFNAYSDGALRNFMFPANGKIPQLIFEETFHGESKAPAAVSDKLQDTRNSVYNPAAAGERKVEIQILEME